MATELQNPTDQSTMSLVGGIIDDVQDLVKQQIELTKKEVADEVQKASQAGQLFALGGGILAIGLVIGVLSLVYLLHWMTAPTGSDPASIPLWACHALVAAPLLGIGGYLTYLGKSKLDSINPLHNSAAEALKENVKWAKDQVAP